MENLMESFLGGRLDRLSPNSFLVSEPIVPIATPIHKLSLSVNPQSSSSLYNGKIPAEIRDKIFYYAMTEYTKPDPESQYPESTNYTRPGYTGKRTITIELMLACRRMYLETYHIPMVTKEHVFWHKRWPDHAVIEEKQYFKRLLAWQMELVKEIHLFTQLFWLEQTFPIFSGSSFLQGMEKLKITIRRGDWWLNEKNVPLGINPQRGNGNHAEMKRDWQREKAGDVIRWSPIGWGCAFANMKNLKELELELETSEDKVPELKAIVEKAKTWKFPMNNGLLLSADGLDVKTTMWRSKECYWSPKCPYCPGRLGCQGENEKCVEKRALIAQGLGPMCTIISLRYELAKPAGQR